MFIAIEGIDGSGKSSTCTAIADILRESRREVLVIDRKHPTFSHSYISDCARKLGATLWPDTPSEPQYLLGDTHFVLLTAAWLGLIDRHIVRPALENPALVLIDGWTLKAVARHALRENVPAKLIEECFSSLSRPDLVIYLDVDESIAAGRKKTLSNAESGVNDGFTGSVNDFILYQSRVKRKMVDILDGTGSTSIKIDANRSSRETVQCAYQCIVQFISANTTQGNDHSPTQLYCS